MELCKNSNKFLKKTGKVFSLLVKAGLSLMVKVVVPDKKDVDQYTNLTSLLKPKGKGGMHSGHQGATGMKS